MAVSGAASKVAKKFQNSKINQKLTKKLDDITSSLKSKTKNITANIAKKTKEATQKAVNTVSDKAKTIANKTLSGTNTVKNAISNGIKNAPKGEKNKVASVIDSLGEGILSVRNVFAPQKVINAGPINIVVKDIKTGFGQSGEETLSQFLSKDVKQLKTMFFSQGNKSVNDSNKVLGGSFKKVDASRGTDEVGHYLSQNAYNVNELGMTRNEGPALLMTKEDHALTRTYRGRGKQTMIVDKGLNARQRMVWDIINIRENFGTKYNKGLLEAIKYAKTLPQFQK